VTEEMRSISFIFAGRVIKSFFIYRPIAYQIVLRVHLRLMDDVVQLVQVFRGSSARRSSLFTTKLWLRKKVCRLQGIVKRAVERSIFGRVFKMHIDALRAAHCLNYCMAVIEMGLTRNVPVLLIR